MTLSDPNNKAVDIAGKNAMIENENLKIELVKVQAERDSLKKALITSQEYIEGEQRAKLTPMILQNTNMTKEEVMHMSLDDMFSLTETFRIIKPKLLATSVRPAVEDEPEQDARLTVPRKFKYGRS